MTARHGDKVRLRYLPKAIYKTVRLDHIYINLITQFGVVPAHIYQMKHATDYT